ncbi:hypothetical protein EPD60_12805 [Flaviaesturariibacter flavus]|uniref:Uncharacterized protein n=1 Tax=Flaviaesturariibacter flavus TaxID=2502780 RepID=A0A4R1B5K4_9BACT|nr:hypothetical protein [Flaviaesturariibacter flavus]TCJ13271.1 hypothetical protein EPD60_12805 [Flaviaesturariibacter flavus]
MQLQAINEPGILDELQLPADGKRRGPWWVIAILVCLGLCYMSIIYRSGNFLVRNDAFRQGNPWLLLVMYSGALFRVLIMALVLRRSRWAWPLLFAELVFGTLLSLAQQLRFGSTAEPVMLVIIGVVLLLRFLCIGGLLHRRALAHFGTPSGWRLPAAVAGILLATAYWVYVFKQVLHG